MAYRYGVVPFGGLSQNDWEMSILSPVRLFKSCGGREISNELNLNLFIIITIYTLFLTYGSKPGDASIAHIYRNVDRYRLWICLSKSRLCHGGGNVCRYSCAVDSLVIRYYSILMHLTFCNFSLSICILAPVGSLRQGKL
jgi:hypothetical protein